MNWYCFWVLLENIKFNWKFKCSLLRNSGCDFLDRLNSRTHKFFCLSHSFLIGYLLQIKRSIILWHFSIIFPSFFLYNLYTIATLHVLLHLLEKIAVFTSRAYKLKELHEVFYFFVDVNRILQLKTTRTFNCLIWRSAFWTEKYLTIKIRTLFSVENYRFAIFTNKVMN